MLGVHHAPASRENVFRLLYKPPKINCLVFRDLDHLGMIHEKNPASRVLLARGARKRNFIIAHRRH